MQGAPSRPELAGAVPWRSRLWRKYAAVMVALCVTAIVGFGAAEMLTTLANAKIQADRLQRAQAGEAAQALRAALVNVDRHVAAVNELPWTPGWLGLDTRREEFARLLRLVPAAERIGYRNAAGQELLQLSRRAVDTVVRDIRNSERMPHVDRIWLPGEQSHQRRLHNQAHGIPLAPAVLAELAALAADLGIAALV